MNTQKKFNRRDFIKVASTVTLGGILASCSPVAEKTQDSPTQAPAADEPTLAQPVVEQVTIIFGRHDAVDGDVENIRLFQEQFPNITVEQQQIGSFAEKVPALAAAGNLPDVFRSWEAMCLELARAEQLIDIQPMVDSDPNFKPEDFYENWWNWPVLEGKRYGVPDVIAPHVCFYNADLFDQKGVEYPNPDSFTWDDFEQMARKITDVDNHIFGSETLPVGWTYYHLKMAWQNGGEYFTPDFKKCIIDSPETIEAIQHWADLLLSGEVMPSPSQIVDVGGIGAATELVQAGKIGLQRDGAWVMNNLILGGFKWNMVPEPSNARRDTITHGAFNAIPGTSNKKDAAWQWLNFHCSAQGMYNYGVVGKFPGGRKSSNLITPHPWIVDVPFEVNWDVIPNSLEYGHVLPGPANEGECMKIIGDALQQIYGGTAKAQDLFPAIAPQVTAVLEQV